MLCNALKMKKHVMQAKKNDGTIMEKCNERNRMKNPTELQNK